MIDSPLVQRLRYIHQTAFTYLLYPSANHTRFEHSLGVANIVSRIFRSLKNKKETERELDGNNLRELRLAALLHDVGHGPFSHSSEIVMKNLPYVTKELKKEKFSPDKPHEMISYYITNSDVFKEYLTMIFKTYKLPVVNVDRIPNLIIGTMEDPEREGYLGDIINGPFDADKLDYVSRDAHFSGIKMSYDLERFLLSVSIDLREGHQHRIINNLNGVHVLEQLLFCKMFLYPTIYHHHKVRATNCMLASLFETIHDNDISVNGHSFKIIADFLHFNDYDLLYEAKKIKKLEKQANDLLYRNLLMRCLVITRHTIEEDTLSEFDKLVKIRRDDDAKAIEIVQKIRSEICSYLEKKDIKIDHCDIWLDLPTFPRFSEPGKHYIRMTSNVLHPLGELFPASQWAISFAQFKWKGHIFGPLKYQKEIAKAAKFVIEDQMGIRFTPAAEYLTKQRTEE